MKKILTYSLCIIIGLVLGVAGIWYPVKNNISKEIESYENIIASKDTEIEMLKNTVSSKDGAIKIIKDALASGANDVEELRKKLKYASQPDLPIQVRVRKAFLTDTMVLQLTNYSNKTFRVEIKWSAEGTFQATIVQLIPNQVKELGQKEGFPFQSGDHISINAIGYKPESLTIP